MVSNEPPEGVTVEDTNVANESQLKDEGHNHESQPKDEGDNYESQPKDEGHNHESQPKDEGDNYETYKTTENNDPVEVDEGDRGDKNEEQNVLDLEVVPEEPPPPPPPSQDADAKPKEGENIPRSTVIYRAGWGARPSKEPPGPPLEHPIDTVIFLHTGPRAEECHDHLECTHRLQELQRVNMFEDGMPDIQYNFMVTSDNTIYEGRGWKHSGTKDPAYKQFEGKSLDICFIGDFTGREPPDNMLKAALGIIGEGIDKKRITKVVNFCRLHSNRSVTVDFGNFARYMLPS